MSKDDNNYHDYVIKDGRFIGRFEEMYQNCDDPWHQDKYEYSSEGVVDGHSYKRMSIECLKAIGYRNFNKILDIGCGKGNFTNFIHHSYPEAKIHAVDISETATTVAGNRYENIDFYCTDITREALDYSVYDCIFMNETMWYVLPQLKELFQQINTGLLRSQGIFVLNNHLYQDEKQIYGREYITTIETLLELMPFKIIHTLENNRFKNYDITIICKAADKQIISHGNK